MRVSKIPKICPRGLWMALSPKIICDPFCMTSILSAVTSPPAALQRHYCPKTQGVQSIVRKNGHLPLVYHPVCKMYLRLTGLLRHSSSFVCQTTIAREKIVCSNFTVIQKVSWMAPLVLLKMPMTSKGPYINDECHPSKSSLQFFCNLRKIPPEFLKFCVNKVRLDISYKFSK